MPGYDKIEYPVAQIRKWIERDGQTLRWVAEKLQLQLDPRVTDKLVHKVCKKHQIRCQRTGPRAGKKHPDWRGGRIVNKDGYVEVYCPDHPNRRKHNRYILEHRLVMEQHLGRLLTKQEVVHHKNGVKDDNRLENLELYQSNEAHLAETLKGQCPKWTKDGLRRMKEGQKNRVAPPVSRAHRETLSRQARLSSSIGQAIGHGGFLSKQKIRHFLNERGVTLEEAYEMDAEQLKRLARS